MIDKYFMKLALAEARAAFDEGEIPIGAVIVSDSTGRILGRGHNMTELLGDVTAHAEMLAITAAQQAIGGKYLKGCTLYVTVEPCIMCAGAIGWSQISRIVIGAMDEKRGYSKICNPEMHPFHPKGEIVKGILEEECRTLMQHFFQSLR